MMVRYIEELYRGAEVAVRSLSRTGAEELATGSDLRAGKEDRAEVDLVGSAEAEAAARAMVEFCGDVVAEPLSEMGEMSTFGQILAEQTVGVFVRAAFPGVVGSGEVEGRAECAFEVLVAMELRSVVRGERTYPVRLGGKQFDRASVGVLDGRAGQRADADQAALALDDGHDAGLAPTMDGIDLPVAVARAAFDDRRALLDHTLSGQSATAIMAGVALAPPFLRTAQVAPERSPVLPVPPDVQVDRLVTHDRRVFASQPTDDLRRTPVLLKQCFHWSEVQRAEASVAARAPAAPVAQLHGHVRAIRPVVRRGVALHFARNRARVPSQCRRDLRRSTPVLPQCSNLISFLRRQLSINHRTGMSHLLPESKKPNKALEPTPTVGGFDDE